MEGIVSGITASLLTHLFLSEAEATENNVSLWGVCSAPNDTRSPLAFFTPVLSAGL